MPLRVGVIGLGRRWRRYRPILSELRKHIEVRAVCDCTVHRAESVAKRLRCAVAGGPVDLLERGDVEAVLLLDAQWFGLFPLEVACRTNKPVYCALTPDGDEGHADALHRRIQSSGLPVLMAMSPVLAPATIYLRELLAQRLGKARLVRADWSMASPSADSSCDPLRSPGVLSLLAACAWLMDEPPRSIWAIDGESESFVTLVMRFGGERLAQVTLWTATVGRAPIRFEASAETGTAIAELPRQLRWRDADGRTTQGLPPRSAERNGLERFLIALRSGQPLRPSFDDAHQALTWLRAAQRSRAEGQRIALVP